jgi:Ca-activated chloride channel family protein
VDVALVLVPVVVRDATGRPVVDLRREEFTVLEDGVPQPLEAFGREERPVSIMLALDTSLSMRPHELGVKRAALEFVRGQREGIAFALEVFSDAVLLEQDFTARRSEVEAAVGAVRAQGEATALFDAVAAAARHLGSREGGRVAVVFTDGTDTVHPQDEAERRLSEAIGASVRGDVAVYTVAFGPRAATWVLRRVSDETGGETHEARSAEGLASAFASIGEAVGSRYLLGYRPPAGRSSGFRRIDVRVGRPGLRVTARSGYYAG